LISRALASLIGAILFLYGVIAALSPLPLGLPLMVLGFLMFAGANPVARPLLQRLRQRWGWFDALVRQVGKRSSGRFRDVLKDTEPKREDNDDPNATQPKDHNE
jgi:hypothetical protein